MKTDEGRLDRRDKLKLGVGLLVGLPLVFAADAINDLYVLAIFVLLAATYAVERWRVRRSEAKRALAAVRSRGSR